MKTKYFVLLILTLVAIDFLGSKVERGASAVRNYNRQNDAAN